MAGTVTVKDVVIGEGMPKICIPLVGATAKELIREAEALLTLGADVAEWRTDFFAEVENLEAVLSALAGIRRAVPDIPLIFTFRSAREGGEREISDEYYAELNRTAAESGMTDLIDVELFAGDDIVTPLIEWAHERGVRVVVSNHDFHKTPPKEVIVARLRKMQELGGDLPKIAVMPLHAGDVLTLLDATRIMHEQFADRPIITMSMAGKGIISRLAGELFGSALTFGSAKAASAPGQLPAAELRDLLELMHRNL
ncbi:type I 3-dehydroquinate dehydratase [Paenibacillus sp. HN-1]|uniref:type I 3-dehydroquinate dehydratase n=1 Tax=Paenibacillus TaxID=44249 RepID=UPI001CA9CE4C|nr:MULTISPECIES: type I 3-dehydroquinate dehydratase [Paenibacillus]MBY9078555.1 type I 3-dehydroquinate dehydratase [Paenibacillus sp. CGMCC 1.18879]MBY9082705.1 type I 3-dehydroquinate dehydratase [Paenibacillus sinensis]